MSSIAPEKISVENNRPSHFPGQVIEPWDLEVGGVYQRLHGKIKIRLIVASGPYSRERGKFQGLFIDAQRYYDGANMEKIRPYALADLGVTPYPCGIWSQSRLVRVEAR